MANQINNQPNVIEASGEASKKSGKKRPLGGIVAALLLTLSVAGCEEPDTTPPTVKGYNVNITQPEKLHLDMVRGEITVGDKPLFKFRDDVDVSTDLEIVLKEGGGKTYSGKSIDNVNIDKSGDIQLTLTCTDRSKNKGLGDSKINYNPPLPEFSHIESSIKISEAMNLTIGNKRVRLGDTTIMQWDDDNCSIELTFNGNPIKSFPFLIDKNGYIEGILSNKIGKSPKPAKTNIEFDGPQGPNLNLLVSEPNIDVSVPKVISRNGKRLLIGEIPVLEWDEDECEVYIKYNGNSINIGDTLKNAGDLEVIVKNKEGLSSSQKFKLEATNKAPEISAVEKVNIIGGTKIVVSGNKLLLGSEEIASRNDDRTENCNVSLMFNNNSIKSGDIIDKAGKLSLIVTDDEQQSSNKEIIITNNTINGLESLNNLNLQVGEEVDLLSGISFADGVELVKVEIEMNGKRYPINDSHHYTPQFPGTCNIVFTIKGDGGDTAEIKSQSLTIKDIEHQEYQPVKINNIDPESLMPKVEIGDKDVYKHIEHLRIPEISTKALGMMRKYGTGKYSVEEYQELMMRLNPIMLGENPTGYNNYEIIGGKLDNSASGHAHIERYILNLVVKYANFKILDTPSRRDDLYTFCKNNPKKINIAGLSKGAFVDKSGYDSRHEEKYQEYDKEKNWLVFTAGGNVGVQYGWFVNQICQEDYPLPDEQSAYVERSRAHKKTDNILNRHIVITISTDEDGDIDQTNERGESSVFPRGFHDKVLFSGRIFPYKKNLDDKVRAPDGKYNTSFPNYLNVAMACLCFQMFAEVEDVDQLLEMIRSTALKDYIRFNGETQELQLMNPAGFFKKYCMVADIPTKINPGETIALTKKRYKGLIFDIPGTEVKINGKWVPYDKENESLIKSQNPMNLEWRLNGDLVSKYSKDGSVTGKIIAVDDERNGLNLDMEGINVMIERSAQRSMVDIPSSIRSGETIMLTNGSNKGVIYDIPGAQPYIKGKSWIEYNNENKDLVMNQNLKELPWRLNGDLAMKYSKDGYIKGTVYAINDRGKTIDQREVTINIEDFVQNSNHGYIVQGYTKTEGNYMKDEGNYRKTEKGYTKNEGSYKKSEGDYRRSEKGYEKREGNYRKSEGDYKKYAA